jgi:hypothetical protein
MNLSTGVEQVVVFLSASQNPFNQAGLYQLNFGPGDFWPAG